MSQNIDWRLVSYFKKGIKGIQRYIGLQILYISVCMHVISALLGLIIINECHTHVLESSRLYLSSANPARQQQMQCAKSRVGRLKLLWTLVRILNYMAPPPVTSAQRC